MVSLESFFCPQVNWNTYFRQVVFGIDSKDLIPLEDLTVDVAVCLDAWVGMVRNIKTNITVNIFQIFYILNLYRLCTQIEWIIQFDMVGYYSIINYELSNSPIKNLLSGQVSWRVYLLALRWHRRRTRRCFGQAWRS